MFCSYKKKRNLQGEHSHWFLNLGSFPFQDHERKTRFALYETSYESTETSLTFGLEPQHCSVTVAMTSHAFIKKKKRKKKY